MSVLKSICIYESENTVCLSLRVCMLGYPLWISLLLTQYEIETRASLIRYCDKARITFTLNEVPKPSGRLHTKNVLFPGHNHHADHRCWWTDTLIITQALSFKSNCPDPGSCYGKRHVNCVKLHVHWRKNNYVKLSYCYIKLRRCPLRLVSSCNISVNLAWQGCENEYVHLKGFKCEYDIVELVTVQKSHYPPANHQDIHL